MRSMLRPALKLNLGEETDELFIKTVEIVVQYDRSSPSLLQRRLSIGYARAARLMDQLEAAGVVGPQEGSRPREVLITSFESYLEGKGKGDRSEIQEEDKFIIPENYKIPKDIKLTRADNSEWGKQISEVINSGEYPKTKIDYPILFGFDDEGKLLLANLKDVGNLIVVGNPQSKKNNFIDTVLVTLLLKYSPKELRFVLIDNSHYLDFYEGIPHLLAPVITGDQKDLSAYRWVLEEISRREKLFAQAGVRNIDSFNQLKGDNRLSRVLIVTFYDWMGDESADLIKGITSGGARAGVHIFLVTNRMNDGTVSADIKANVPVRAVFKVTSAPESTLSGIKGAENLGVGEMLLKKSDGEPQELSTILTLEANVKEVVQAVKQASTP